jgi:quercetin dioxygenase-like cupin family protein
VRTPGTDFAALEHSVVRCEAGASRSRSSEGCEEVLFVLRGRGRLELDGAAYELEPESGAYLAPGERYTLACGAGSDPLELVCVRIPDPVAPSEAASLGAREVVRRLADQETQAATTNREFRIVANPDTGLRSATHFVGYIPIERAPEHFHTYDEVIHVLEGTGEFQAHGRTDPVGPGSVIELPARTVHCLANTGGGVMRVVAVFRPAGSPANAYYPDGTPAYGDAPPLQTS